MAITFDTLKSVDALERAQMSREQARAVVDAIRTAHDTTLAAQVKIAQEISARAVAELDTKTEHALLKLDAKLDKCVAEIRGEIKVLHWILAFLVAGVGSLVLKAYFVW